jgi:hypothetical protein
MIVVGIFLMSFTCSYIFLNSTKDLDDSDAAPVFWALLFSIGVALVVGALL